MDNRCVSCGEIIPEGRMVCPNCESAFIDNVEFRKDWNLPIPDKELQEYEKIIVEKTAHFSQRKSAKIAHFSNMGSANIIKEREKMSVSMVDGHIDEPKITDNEIIKALECCQRGYCADCLKLHNSKSVLDCMGELIKDTLDLINRQKAEIKRLETENKLLIKNDVSNKYPNCVLVEKGRIYTKTLEDYDNLIGDISAEAVKEFADRLKKEIDIRTTLSKEQDENILFLIDNLLKETVGADAEKSSENVAYIYTIKICKNCIFHNENACRINIGLWKDDDFCSLWKNN